MAPKVIALLLALIIGAEYTGWPVLDQAAAAVLVVLGASFLWSRLSQRGLGFRRRLDSDRASVGENVIEHFEVSNTGRLPKLWLEIWDASTLPGHRASRVLHVPGKGTVRWMAKTPCLRRGQFRVGPVMVRSGDPLGMFPRHRNFSDSHNVVIYPATVDVSRFRLPSRRHSGGPAAMSRYPTVTSTVSGIRDYAPGDPLNRISWSATARTGRMMTKEFDMEPSSDVWIVLDLDRRHHTAAVYPPDHPSHRKPVEPWLDSTVEYAVTIAASLAKRCLEESRLVGLIATAGRMEVIPADRSHGQQIRVLESLAVVQADGEIPLAECLAVEGRRFGRESSVIVITPSMEDSWIRPLAGLNSRGVRAAVVLIEQETFAPAASSLMTVSALTTLEIPVQLVKFGDVISQALDTASGTGRGGIAGFRHG